MFSANASQVSNDVKYIEDFCSVYLRTGTGSSQTVTTGVKENTGALVISKSRSAATDWAWYDTFRGATKELASNTTAAQITQSQGLTSFNTDGHTWGTLAKVNTSGATYVDFVLKPTPKFFDVVTWSGNDVSGRQIAHNLGAQPGMIIVKRIDTTGSWPVYHRSNGATNYYYLNTTNAVAAFTGMWNDTEPTPSVFTVGNNSNVNATGGTYVAYLFAHNAGGFGLTGTDNVISCGSFTTVVSTDVAVNLGWEPQFVLWKRASSVGNWNIADTMRGNSWTQWQKLYPNTGAAEAADSAYMSKPTSTGFIADQSYGLPGGETVIYIAIRRGPMKTPTSGTSVFSPITATDTEGQGTVKTTNFPIDLQITKSRASSGSNFVADRLRGISTNTTDSAQVLITNNTDAETSGLTITRAWNNTGFQISGAIGNSSQVYWNFRRAPGFFDVVCYTGTGSNTTQPHNLGVAPELMIVKRRDDGVFAGRVYHKDLGANYWLYLFYSGSNAAVQGPNSAVWNGDPTSTYINLGSDGGVNASGSAIVAWLFASCPGISKVGSYTGTGTTQQINCGFTSGARLVLIKRTDSTGDWYVWDSARGIVAGNDPYLLLNSTAAEVTSTDYVDTYSAGFEISSTAPAAINASGGTFIYLAIA